MPAAPSLLIDRLAGQEGLGEDEYAGLADFLAGVADPRARRGLRYSLVSVLMVMIAAVLAGARSFTAIGEWAADAPQPILAALGLGRRLRGGARVAPDESTIRKIAARVDGDGLDEALGPWLARRARPGAELAVSGDGHTGGDECQQPRVVLPGLAFDGKVVRGAKAAGGVPPHLLSAITHEGVVLAQRQVGKKTNEISGVRELLGCLNLHGVVVTGDAMHTQRGHARFLVEVKKAHFVFAVKGNQPGLFAQLDALPWDQVPIACQSVERNSGRLERRTIRVLPAPQGIRFPHTAQVFLLERYVTTAKGVIHAEAVLGVTSLNEQQASPADLAGYVRRHWTVEVRHESRTG